MTAFDPDSRLRLARVVGKRGQALWERLLRKVQERLLRLPVFESDGERGCAEALVEVFGKVPSYQGRGRPPTVKRPKELLYGQVVKHRKRGRLVAVEERIVFGEEGEVCEALGGRGRVSTSLVERTHLTARQSNGRLVRKTLSYSKRKEMLEWACAWEDLVYNFAKPVKTLRRAWDGGVRRWEERTPAMAAGLTGHVWSLEELFTLVAPEQQGKEKNHHTRG